MDSSIFQTMEWEEFKLKTGYEKSFRISDILVLAKNLPLGRTMLYSPMVSLAQWEKIQPTKLIENLRHLVDNKKALFYRVELDIPKDKNITLPPIFAKSFEEMQPEHTLILDLTKSEEVLLVEMKQKGRYNIKIAEREGVSIRSGSDAKLLEDFYTLYQTMAKRQGITYRSQEYFSTLLDILGKKDYARVYAAYTTIEEKEVPLAAAIISFFDNKAIYLFGGSNDNFRNKMAPYKLHWEAIKEAKNRGCLEYDFFGVAPENEPNHPWSGVTRFKQQFGGIYRQIYGSYDLVLDPLGFKMFKIAEKIRRR